MLNIDKLIKLLKIIQNHRYLAALSHKAAAGVEHSSILGYLNSNNFRTVVDIGANRGQFALVARNYFPGAKIISFEPLKGPAAIFRRVFIADKNVALHEIAIGAKDEEMTIHVSRADDSSSLLPITLLQNKLYPGTDEKEVRAIQVKTLDAVLGTNDIEKPALLKLDVQGFERQALDGCRSLLPLFSYIYAECSFLELYEGQSLAHQVISFLDGFGFVLSGIYNLGYDKKGSAIQGDFLFKNNNF